LPIPGILIRGCFWQVRLSLALPEAIAKNMWRQSRRHWAIIEDVSSNIVVRMHRRIADRLRPIFARRRLVTVTLAL
jgi:hypothetical protein